MKKLISVLASALLLSAVMSNSLSAFAAESNVPETTESATVASAEESELITDYETIRSMLDVFIEEQNYDELLGAFVWWSYRIFPDGKSEPRGNIIVSFDSVPLDDLDLDIEAAEKFKEYMKQNNIDSSLVEFDMPSQKFYYTDGMITDLKVIYSMIREFLDSQNSKSWVFEPDANARYPRVTVVFPQKSIEEGDYTDEDFQPLKDFMKESNINPLLVRIAVLDDAPELVEPEPVSGDVDGDGKATLYDAIIVCKCMIGAKDVTEDQKVKADINGDGNVDLYDAIYVAKCMIQ